MSYSALRRAIEERTQLSGEEADAITATCVSAIVRSLGAPTRQRLAEAWGLDLSGPHEPVVDVVGAIADEHDISLAVARELLEVVGAAVAETQDEDTVELLRANLRPSLAPYIAPSEAPTYRPPRRRGASASGRLRSPRTAARSAHRLER